MGLKFGRQAPSLEQAAMEYLYDVEVAPHHQALIKQLTPPTESPKPLGKRARRRLRGRLKQEKRNGKA